MNAGYTYVWLNGEQLIQGHDYTVSGNTITVVGKTITSSDRLDVMYFALESATGATGFRIFKDMMNRTFYKRISKTATTKLTLDMTEGTQQSQWKTELYCQHQMRQATSRCDLHRQRKNRIFYKIR